MIADIKARANPAIPWRTCATCHLLRTLPENEAADLIDLLSDTGIEYRWLANELGAEGHPVPWESLARHARGGCSAKTRLRAEQ